MTSFSIAAIAAWVSILLAVEPGGAFQGPLTTGYPSSFRTSSTALRRQSDSKWDNLVDEDEPPPISSPDMKYIPRNVMRQNQHFVAIREAGGKELTNDVWVQEPNDSEIFWFVGKVARISDVSVEQAVARQYDLIEHHAGNLRPIELFPSRGYLKIWVAPGDSELEVAYNRPSVVFKKMSRTVEGASGIKNNVVGFQGEVYEGGPQMGFRTWRTSDGKPAKPEIQTPEVPGVSESDGSEEEYSEEKYRTPTDEELKKIQQALQEKNMNIEELYEQQQQREGNISDQ